MIAQAQVMHLTATYKSPFEDMHIKLMTHQNAILFAKSDVLHPTILFPTKLQKLLFATKLPRDRIASFPFQL